MDDVRAGSARGELTSRQAEALWKWRWLGFRDSTPAFKACLALAAAIAFALVAYALVALH